MKSFFSLLKLHEYFTTKAMFFFTIFLIPIPLSKLIIIYPLKRQFSPPHNENWRMFWRNLEIEMGKSKNTNSPHEHSFFNLFMYQWKVRYLLSKNEKKKKKRTYEHNLVVKASLHLLWDRTFKLLPHIYQRFI